MGLLDRWGKTEWHKPDFNQMKPAFEGKQFLLFRSATRQSLEQARKFLIRVTHGRPNCRGHGPWFPFWPWAKQELWHVHTRLSSKPPKNMHKTTGSSNWVTQSAPKNLSPSLPSCSLALYLCFNWCWIAPPKRRVGTKHGRNWRLGVAFLKIQLMSMHEIAIQTVSSKVNNEWKHQLSLCATGPKNAVITSQNPVLSLHQLCVCPRQARFSPAFRRATSTNFNKQITWLNKWQVKRMYIWIIRVGEMMAHRPSAGPQVRHLLHDHFHPPEKQTVPRMKRRKASGFFLPIEDMSSFTWIGSCRKTTCSWNQFWFMPTASADPSIVRKKGALVHAWPTKRVVKPSMK